jgi:hypothetical protein
MEDTSVPALAATAGRLPELVRPTFQRKGTMARSIPTFTSTVHQAISSPILRRPGSTPGFLIAFTRLFARNADRGRRKCRPGDGPAPQLGGAYAVR